jgi:membrane associated rhomboid family serine protease
MDRAPAINLPPVVIWLAVALAGVHVLRQFLPSGVDEWVLYAFAFLPERYSEAGAALPGGIAARYWTPLTYAFLHADYVHLLVNLIWMASFGGPLARRFGAVRFLLLALVASVAGAAMFYFVGAGNSAVIGASGGVSGMMAGTARFAFSPGGPLAGGRTHRAFLVPAEPLSSVVRNGRAVAFILIWFVVNLIFGLAGGLVPGASGPIAWQAHVGGFLAGLVCFPLLDPIDPHSEPLASERPPS